MTADATFTETEWLARTDDVSVRVNTLAPGQGTSWHFHTKVTDDVFALDDGIEVRERDPDGVFRLGPGERHRVPPGRIHAVANGGTVPARYLLVQATGRYDFNAVE